MKILLISITGSICIAVALGIMIISGAIDMSSILHLQTTSQRKCCSLPVLPGLAISINGTSSVNQFLQFDVRPGQNVTLLVNVTTEPKVLPVTLSVSPKLGFSKDKGVNWQLSSSHIDSTSSAVLLHISIGKNVRPAKYPMELDANTQAIPNVNFTEVAYFDLAVVQQKPPDVMAEFQHKIIDREKALQIVRDYIKENNLTLNVDTNASSFRIGASLIYVQLSSGGFSHLADVDPKTGLPLQETLFNRTGYYKTNPNWWYEVEKYYLGMQGNKIEDGNLVWDVGYRDCTSCISPYPMFMVDAITGKIVYASASGLGEKK